MSEIELAPACIDPDGTLPRQRAVLQRLVRLPWRHDAAIPDTDLLTAAKIAVALEVSDAEVKQTFAALELKFTAEKVCSYGAKADVPKLERTPAADATRRACSPSTCLACGTGSAPVSAAPRGRLRSRRR